MPSNFNSSNEIFSNMLKGLKDGNNKLNSIDKTTKDIANKKSISKDVEETKSNVMTPKDVMTKEEDPKLSILSSITSKMDNHIGLVSNINASIATVTDRVTSSLTMLSAINLNLMRITSVLSAFRADYIMVQNGKTPRGESYVNNTLLTNANSGYHVNKPTKEMSTFISEMNKVGNFANLMSNAVRNKIGSKLFNEKSAQNQNVLAKFLGDDFAPYADMLSMALEGFTGIKTNNKVDLISSLGGKFTGKSSDRFKKDTFGKLRNFTDTLENDPNSGMIKQMLGSILGEKLDNLGIDRKDKKQREADPNMVMSALAPHADEIRQTVEGLITGFRRKPNIIPDYAIPVWIVNSKTQTDFIKAKGKDKDTREEQYLNERIKDILEGRNTNKLDRDGNELLKMDYDPNATIQDNVTFSGKYADQLIKNNKRKGISESDTIKNTIKHKLDYNREINRVKTPDFYEVDENGNFVKVTDSDEELNNYNQKSQETKRNRTQRADEIDQGYENGEYGRIRKYGKKFKNFMGENFDEVKNTGSFLKGVFNKVRPGHASGTVNKTQLKNDEGITGSDVNGQQEATLHPGEKVLSASQVKEVNQLNDVTAMLGDVSYKILLLTQVANQFSSNFVTWSNHGKISPSSLKFEGLNSVFKKTGASSSKIGQTVLSLMGKVHLGSKSVIPSAEEEGEGEQQPSLIDKAKGFLKETKVGKAVSEKKEEIESKINKKKEEVKEEAKNKIKEKLDNAYDAAVRKYKWAKQVRREKKKDKSLKAQLKLEEKAKASEIGDEKKFNLGERMKKSAHNLKERVNETAHNLAERGKDLVNNLFNRKVKSAAATAEAVTDVTASGSSALTKVAGAIPLIGKVIGPVIGVAAIAGLGVLAGKMLAKVKKGKADADDGGLLKKLAKKVKKSKSKKDKDKDGEDGTDEESEKKKNSILSALKEKLELREVYVDKKTGVVKRKKDNSIVMKRNAFGKETDEPLVVGKGKGRGKNTLQFLARLKSHELKLVKAPNNVSSDAKLSDESSNSNGENNNENNDNDPNSANEALRFLNVQAMKSRIAEKKNGKQSPFQSLFGVAKNGISSLFGEKGKKGKIFKQILTLLMPMVFMGSKMKKKFTDMLKSPFGSILLNKPELASNMLFTLNGGASALELGSLGSIKTGSSSSSSSTSSSSSSGSSKTSSGVTSANIADKNAGYSDNAAVAYSQYKEYMRKQEAINQLYEELGYSKAQTDSDGNAITTSQIVALELMNGNNGTSSSSGSTSSMTNTKASIYSSAAGHKPEDYFTSTMPGSYKSSGFYRNDGVTFHGGIDIAAAEGTPVYTPVGGKVIAKYVNHSECGNLIAIQDADGFVHRMMHFQSPALYNEGDQVEAGALVGYVGNTGQSFGAHLHYDVCSNSDSINGQGYAFRAGTLINPEDYTYPKSTTAPVVSTVNSAWDAKMLKENQIKDGSTISGNDDERQKQEDSLAYYNNDKGKAEDTKSGKGSGSSYINKNPLYAYDDNGNHIYQKDYQAFRYNTGKDKTVQTLSDSGCGPAVAATVGNIYSGMGSDNKFINAANFALSKNYKETDGGYLIATFIFERYKLKFRELLGGPKLL